MKKGLAYLSGIGEENILDVIEELDELIPDAILDEDVTEMTEGELQQYIMSERLSGAAKRSSGLAAQKYQQAANIIESGNISGIGALSPDMQHPVSAFIHQTNRLTDAAFVLPTLRIRSDEEAEQLAGLFKKVIKKIGKGAKAAGKGIIKAHKTVGKGIIKAHKTVGKAAIKAAKTVAKGFAFILKKLLNFLVKVLLPAASPFFLFTFIKKRLNSKVSRRKAKQEKLLGFIQKTTGMKRSNINSAMKNGIIKKYGVSPEDILNAKAGAKIGAIPPIPPQAIIKASGFVIQAISKISKLFKKKGPKVEGDAGSDLDLITADGAPIADDIPNFEGDSRVYVKAPSQSSGNNTLLLVGGTLATLLGLKAFKII